jgi:hypothetical protein
MNTTGSLSDFLAFVVIAGGITHRVICFIRDRTGGYWHSYSEGISWLRIPYIEKELAKRNYTIDVTKVILEPLAVAFVSLLALGADMDYYWILTMRSRTNVWFIYFLSAAIIMCLYQIYCYNVRRNMLLDEKDAAVISEIRAKLMAQDSEPGIFEHKGVTYSVLGGKKTSDQENK